MLLHAFNSIHSKAVKKKLEYHNSKFFQMSPDENSAKPYHFPYKIIRNCAKTNVPTITRSTII